MQLLQVETDSEGSFSVALPRAGAYALRVEKLGHETLTTESFRVGGAEILELRVFVGVAAVPLAPVEVLAPTARSNPVRMPISSGVLRGVGRPGMAVS